MKMPERRIMLSPSLITLDMTNLESQVRELERSGAKMLHVDILDGHFSPSMPLGLDTVRQLREKTELPFDCHVMVTEPDFFVDELLDIGVQQIVFQAENRTSYRRTAETGSMRRGSVRELPLSRQPRWIRWSMSWRNATRSS
jgi:pentose-5-phosphate-3-epimerase